VLLRGRTWKNLQDGDRLEESIMGGALSRGVIAKGTHGLGCVDNHSLLHVSFLYLRCLGV
jgi:hypothetical protein